MFPNALSGSMAQRMIDIDRADSIHNFVWLGKLRQQRGKTNKF